MWKMVKLGEMLETGAGGTPLKSKKEYYEAGDIKWLMSGAVCEKEIVDSSTFITNEGLNNSSAKLFPPNTVLVAMYGATAGQVGILRVEAATNQAVCGIYPSKDYLPEFLYYYLLSYKEKLLEEVSGVAQPNLSQIKIKNIPIPKIPLAEQQRIVAKLDAIFAEIDKATAAAEANARNAEALFQSYLTQVFERGGEGWETLSIKDLIKIRSGDFLPAKNMNNEGAINVYGGNGISGKHNAHNLSGDNIIIGRVGAKCGNVRLVSGDVWITDNAFYISEYKRKVNKEFLSVALAHKDLRKLANQMAQPVISFTTIKDAELNIPSSVTKQVEFLEIKNAIKHQVQIVKISQTKKVNLLLLLKQSILKQAFNGELVKE